MKAVGKRLSRIRLPDALPTTPITSGRRQSSGVATAASRDASAHRDDDDDDTTNSDRDRDFSFSMHSMPELPDPTISEKERLSDSQQSLNLSDRGDYQSSCRRSASFFDPAAAEGSEGAASPASPMRQQQRRQRPSFLFGLAGEDVPASPKKRPSLFGRDHIPNATTASNRPMPKSILRAGRELNRMAQQLLSFPSTTKKTVQFNERHNQVSGIEQRHDLPADIIEAVWFTDQQVADMKREMDDVAYALDNGVPDADGEAKGRGLEGRTEEGNWLSYKARLDATNAVLDEQDEQCANRRLSQRLQATVTLDDDAIREVYLEVSEQYREQALERGQSDAQEAVELQRETREQHEAWLERQDELQIEQMAKHFQQQQQEERTSTISWQDQQPERGAGEFEEYEEEKVSSENTGGDRLVVHVTTTTADSHGPEQAPPSVLNHGKRQSWFSQYRVSSAANGGGRRRRKQSWFVRARKSFDSAGVTQSIPGVGITTRATADVGCN